MPQKQQKQTEQLQTAITTKQQLQPWNTSHPHPHQQQQEQQQQINNLSVSHQRNETYQKQQKQQQQKLLEQEVQEVKVTQPIKSSSYNSNYNQAFDHQQDDSLSITKSNKYNNKQEQQLNAQQYQPAIKFSQLHPAQQKYASKSPSLSLEFDIKSGWIPKSQITGPLPLAYTHPDTDDIIQQKDDKGLVIYYGQRYNNSFAMHRKFYQQIDPNNINHTRRKYPFHQFHLCKSKFLQLFFKKHYSDFEYDHKREVGMVANSIKTKNQFFVNRQKQQEQPLQFDSNFQGGNLDAVYYQQGEYRLMLRTDANTRGHCNYFYFKVKSKKAGKFCFRIMNMSKPVSLYQRNMKPYVKIKGDHSTQKWSQTGTSNVRYGLSPLNQEYQDITRKMYSLRFQYIFGADESKKSFKKKKSIKDQQNNPIQNMEVQFCYGIPFVYSDLIAYLEELRSDPNFYLNKLCFSLSGVQIPLVTITENQKANQQINDTNDPTQQEQKNKKKYLICILGRVHPGQTHGSHIINGLISSLLANTPEAKLLRSNIIFKIVPMLNPDGVIIGNTRTSLSGKDLNRVYTDKIQFVYPEIAGIRDYIKKLKHKYGSKFLFLIDVHGHSTRKNSFFFGPQYPVFDQQYNKCRMLARIFAKNTEVFRYYSCKFRLSSTKQKTCRGYFNSKNIVRVYTYQTSMHGYYNFAERTDTPFTKEILQNIGQNMMLTIHDYVSVTFGLKIIEIPEPIKKKKNNKKQIKQLEEEQIQAQESDSEDMGSDKADSQDDNDDFDPLYLQVFYNRINENKQYFYQQLLAQSKLDSNSNNRSPKRKQVDKNTINKVSKIQELTPKAMKSIRQLRIQEQLLNLQNKNKINQKKSNNQVDYLFLKKKQFMEYEKLSSVIFGGNNIQIEDRAHQNNKYHRGSDNSNNNSRKKTQTNYNMVTLSPLNNIKSGQKQLQVPDAMNLNNAAVTNGWKNTVNNFKYLTTNNNKLSTLRNNQYEIINNQHHQSSEQQNQLSILSTVKKNRGDYKNIDMFLRTPRPYDILHQKQSKAALQGFQNQREYKGFTQGSGLLYYSRNNSEGNLQSYAMNIGKKSINNNIIQKQTELTGIKFDNDAKDKGRNLSLSLRKLPRKKSIKSFKQEEQCLLKKKLLKNEGEGIRFSPTKKYSKKGQKAPLTKKLPYLDKVIRKI